MRNPQTLRLLWIALAVEIGFGLICLLASRAFPSFLVIVIILGFLGGAGFFARTTGLWTGDWSGTGHSVGRYSQQNWVNRGAINNMSGTTSGWNLGNVSFNLGNYPERSEVINQTEALEEGVTQITVNVLSGSLRVTGQEELNETKLTAVRRVWARDEMTARLEMDRLQLRTWREGNILRIEAGDPTQGLVVGRGPRIEVELVVPASLAANFSTSNGELSCRQFNGELTARTTVGALTVEAYNSGRNVSLSTTSGRITLQNVAAGIIKVRAGAGSIQLTGVGAEQLELEATAGNVRARGVNCGRYSAHATTGSLDLYEGRVEQGLEMKTGAGRIQADSITTNSFKLEAATGAVFYRGVAPTSPSEVNSGVGSVQLLFSPGAAFNLDAQSSIGSVETYLPISAVAYQSRSAFTGQIAGGGAPIRVNSQVGSIRVAIG